MRRRLSISSTSDTLNDTLDGLLGIHDRTSCLNFFPIMWDLQHRAPLGMNSLLDAKACQVQLSLYEQKWHQKHSFLAHIGVGYCMCMQGLATHFVGLATSVHLLFHYQFHQHSLQKWVASCCSNFDSRFCHNYTERMILISYGGLFHIVKF